MQMKLITVGTGSTGNCYLLQRENDSFVALDCGCPWNKVMIASRFRPTSIKFALVTHTHSDHACCVRDFKRNGIDVYGPDVLVPKKALKIGDVTVVPFEVPHDVQCFGYLIKVDGRTIIYMTDFGYCRYTFKSWNVNTWIIACNHLSPPDSEQANYSHVVWGHSSLNTVKDILEASKSEALKNIILVHYNESQDLDSMVDEIQTVVGDQVKVALAKKGEVITI